MTTPRFTTTAATFPNPSPTALYKAVASLLVEATMAPLAVAIRESSSLLIIAASALAAAAIRETTFSGDGACEDSVMSSM